MNMYDIFHDHYPHWKSSDGLFGLEIETEVSQAARYPKEFQDAFNKPTGTKTDPMGNSHTVWANIPLKFWEAVDDGSLRNYGMEYVLRKPLSFTKTLEALDEFDKVLGKVKWIEDAPATSVHVHVNMQNETPLTVANFVCLWVLFENPLVEFCGPTRRSNLFAAPTRCAEGILDNFIKFLSLMESGSQSAVSWSDNAAKYSALNVATMYKFGSLEARTMRGTTDMGVLSDWVSMLHKLYLFAKTPGLTPNTLLKKYEEREGALLFDVFGEFGNYLNYNALVPMIDRNVGYVMRLAQCSKNWETYGMAYVKIKDDTSKIMAKYATQINDYITFAQTATVPAPWTIVDETDSAPENEDGDDF